MVKFLISRFADRNRVDLDLDWQIIEGRNANACQAFTKGVFVLLKYARFYTIDEQR